MLFSGMIPYRLKLVQLANKSAVVTIPLEIAEILDLRKGDMVSIALDRDCRAIKIT